MKKIFSFVYRVLIIIVTFYALFLNFKLLTFKTGILYFTNLSNLLVLGYFIILVIEMIIGKQQNSSIHYIIKGMVTMCITLTMFVYNLVLISNAGIFKNHMLECNLVHLVVPILVIFDYILFGEKGNLKKIYPFYWTIFLFMYQIFVVSYMLLGGTFANGDKYPYFYMNVSKYGILGVFINCFIILIVYILYGELIRYIDNRVGKLNNK